MNNKNLHNITPIHSRTFDNVDLKAIDEVAELISSIATDYEDVKSIFIDFEKGSVIVITDD